jgi:hypothetical protein
MALMFLIKVIISSFQSRLRRIRACLYRDFPDFLDGLDVPNQGNHLILPITVKTYSRLSLP